MHPSLAHGVQMHPPEVLSTSGPSSRHAASRIGARKDESVLTLAEFKEALLRTAVAYCGDKHSDLQETLKTALGILIVKYRMDAL